MSRKRILEFAAYGVTIVALGLAAKAAQIILNDPGMYTGVGPDGQPKHASLVQVNDESVIPKVLFPVFLTLVALVLPWRKVRITLTIVLWAFVIFGGMTIGLYYFPAAVAMLVATLCQSAAEKNQPASSN